MKLDQKEFKRFKELSAKAKSGKLDSSEKEELANLTAKRNERGSNDLAWWDRYPVLADAVSNIAFNFIQGTQIDLTDLSGSSQPTHFGSVAKVKYLPTIGHSRDSSSGFNAQMRQLWLDMHRKYRGMGGYQRADLGMAILAIAAVFETIAKAERIYGVISTYKVMNRNVPNTLYEALNIDASIANELADFRYGINWRISKLQQLCLPKGIAAIEAALVQVSNIYKDSDDPRAALFLFDPDFFGIYDPSSFSSGGVVKYQKFSSVMTGTTPGGSAGFTKSDLFGIIDTQMNALLNDDDIAKMCSDLIAAYGSENVVVLLPLPEDYRVEPVHDYERTLQFHNLTIVGDVCTMYEHSVVSAAGADALLAANTPVIIYQYDDVIYNALTRDVGSYVDTGSQVVNVDTSNFWNDDHKAGLSDACLFDTWVDKPGKLEVLCGTRFTTLCGRVRSVTVSGTTYYNQGIDAYGTNVVTSVEVFTRGSTGGVTKVTIDASLQGISNLATFYNAWNKFLQIDWHPYLYVINTGMDVLGDIDNVTKITTENLARIHDCCIYSVFAIPAVSYIN